MCDLWIVVDNRVTFKQHINVIHTKAKKVMGLITRIVGFNAPVIVKKQLYVSLVRSICEYSSCVWAGLNIENSIKLESIQRRASLYILHYPDMTLSWCVV